jgi:YD repeat-containing protein
VSRRLLRCLLALAGAAFASVTTPYSARAQQCPLGPATGPTSTTPGTAGPSAGFLYDPFRASRAICVWDVNVTPKNAAGPNWGPNTSGHTATFTVTNSGSGGSTDSYTLTCLRTGNVTCTSVSPTIANLTNGQQQTVTVTYAAGAPSGGSSGTVWLKAAGVKSDSGNYNVTVGVPIPTLVSIPFDNQDMNRCAASCFQYAYAQSTVPYFSLGAARAVTLVYRQDRNVTQPFINVDVQQPAGSTTFPVKYWLQATLNGAQVTFANGEQTLKFVSQVQVRPERLAGQLNRDTTRVTGVYPLTITVTAEWSGGATTQATISTKLAIIEEKSSPVARGWTLGGIQRANIQSDGSALITDGNGSAAYFGIYTPGGPPYIWSSPAGELSRFYGEYNGTTLTAYTRRYPDSTRVWFDPLTGKMTKATDPFGNTTQILYDGSGRVQTIKDPMNRSITLAYDANGLHAITDPGGRVTTVTVQATKLLTQITDPDTKFTSFGYDANIRLTSLTDRRGKATTVYYGVSGLPDSTARPAVPIYGAGTLRPTTRFQAWQTAGVPYTPTNVTPLNPPWTSDAQGRVTEPGGAVTRFTVDRWGQPVILINALGDTTASTYDAAGRLVKRVLPTYGGVSDSIARDTFGLATYKKVATAPAINLRRAPYGQVDSLWGVVTSDGVPIQRPFIGLNGRVDSVAVAGVTRQHTWYDSRGRVDSTLDAKQQFVARYHYDATHGSVDTVYSPGGVKTAYTYDTFGRQTTVKAPASPPKPPITARSTARIRSRPQTAALGGRSSTDTTSSFGGASPIPRVRLTASSTTT